MAKVQDHRYIRVSTVLQDTGFWDYVATLHMKRSDFLKAIDISSDHTDAAIIMPEAKPRNSVFAFFDSARKKNTSADPSEVITNIIDIPITVITVPSIFHLPAIVYSLIVWRSPAGRSGNDAKARQPVAAALSVLRFAKIVADKIEYVAVHDRLHVAGFVTGAVEIGRAHV